VAVLLLDNPVFPVNDEFCSLVAAYLSSQINSLLFGSRVDTRPAGTALFDVPAPLRGRNHMMRFGHTGSFALSQGLVFDLPHKDFLKIEQL